MTLLIDIKQLFEDVLATDISDSLRGRIEILLSDIDKQIPRNSQEGMSLLASAVSELNKISTPDIDAIIPLVEQGMNGYKACSEKIEQVNNYLRQNDTGSNQ